MGHISASVNVAIIPRAYFYTRAKRSYLKREAELASKFDDLSRDRHPASGPGPTARGGRSVVNVEIQDSIPSHPLGSTFYLVLEDFAGLTDLLFPNTYRENGKAEPTKADSAVRELTDGVIFIQIAVSTGHVECIRGGIIKFARNCGPRSTTPHCKKEEGEYGGQSTKGFSETRVHRYLVRFAEKKFERDPSADGWHPNGLSAEGG